MKRLIIFDLDGTLMNTFDPIVGKPMWEKYYNEKFPYKGWWGRKESLDADVFDIKPFPNVLRKLKKEQEISGTQVIILTSRMEKLRSEVEKILNLNDIVVDDVLLKKGNKGKGDVILDIVKYNPDLEEIIVYDDYMNKDKVKIKEYIEIKDKLSDNIKYVLYYVENGKISMLESRNPVLDIIIEEMNNIS